MEKEFGKEEFDDAHGPNNYGQYHESLKSLALARVDNPEDVLDWKTQAIRGYLSDLSLQGVLKRNVDDSNGLTRPGFGGIKSRDELARYMTSPTVRASKIGLDLSAPYTVIETLRNYDYNGFNVLLNVLEVVPARIDDEFLERIVADLFLCVRRTPRAKEGEIAQNVLNKLVKKSFKREHEILGPDWLKELQSKIERERGCELEYEQTE